MVPATEKVCEYSVPRPGGMGTMETSSERNGSADDPETTLCACTSSVTQWTVSPTLTVKSAGTNRLLRITDSCVTGAGGGDIGCVGLVVVEDDMWSASWSGSSSEHPAIAREASR